MRRFEASLGRWTAAVEIGRSASSLELPANKFETGFSSWQEALDLTTGYDSQHILHKAVIAARAVRDGRAAYERDSVTFDRPQVVHSLLAWLLFAQRQLGSVRVLDFGGALGSLYYQHRNFLEPMENLSWGVVEQSHIVEAGKLEFETEALRFFYSIEECVEETKPNFVLLSGVLQYMEKPYDLLHKTLSLGLPYVLLDRTMVQGVSPDIVAIQRVQPVIYDASYPVWFLDLGRVDAAFAEHQYRVLDEFDPYPGSSFGHGELIFPYKSWFLGRRDI